MRDIISESKGENLNTKQLHFITMHNQDLQTKVLQAKGWLSARSMARINGLWNGSLDKRKVRGMVSYCSQHGYRAQVPQYPINSYKYIYKHTHTQIIDTIDKCLDSLMERQIDR